MTVTLVWNAIPPVTAGDEKTAHSKAGSPRDLSFLTLNLEGFFYERLASAFFTQALAVSFFQAPQQPQPFEWPTAWDQSSLPFLADDIEEQQPSSPAPSVQLIDYTPTPYPVIHAMVRPDRFFERGGEVHVAHEVILEDVDDAGFGGVSLVLLYFEDQGGRLAVKAGTDLTGLTVTFNDGYGELSIRGRASRERYESILESVLFGATYTSQDVSKHLISVMLFDGGRWSMPYDFFIQTQPHRPNLHDVAEQVIARADQTSIPLDASLSLKGYGDGETLSRAVLWVRNQDRRIADNVVLDAKTSHLGVTENFDRDQGKLILDGRATVENYIRLLQSVSLDISPQAEPGEYKVNWLVIDGQGEVGDIASQTVTVPISSLNNPAWD